ncbi:M56 family metallopeptidase [Altererythrobacter sp. Root672]|uniref:M56 family metallopeptidase n=1 Tax=Altererythrobacter sp. Root672 TaxID=1736584 RepID=UPI000B0D7E66|nr:M56 family metallopeptidase [Altererythrobacter sp. Root672]
MIVLFTAKSVVIAGGTLLVLRFMRGRSASDRSWIAHLGLAALAALPLGSLLFPPLEVPTSYASVLAEAATASSGTARAAPIAPAVHTPVAEPGWAQPAADWLLLAYAVIALFLIARTLLALLRLVLLTARARAVTDDHWLQALARARLRIGFTKSIALLASHEIASPVSWGVHGPKILLNTDAVDAPADADAIVAHELAHLARADWAKLVLARVSVALFWFNPFAWLLAREAHQLREEAADDAVLAADVEDTVYASLLVSAARLHSNGLLSGAHGVAPSRNSLAQRVRRVLDRGLSRSASGTSWAAAMAIGAAALTAPLMTLQFTDRAAASSASAQFASGDDAEVVVFELRIPPRESDALPKSAQEAGLGPVTK